MAAMCSWDDMSELAMRNHPLFLVLCGAVDKCERFIASNGREQYGHRALDRELCMCLAELEAHNLPLETVDVLVNDLIMSQLCVLRCCLIETENIYAMGADFCRDRVKHIEQRLDSVAQEMMLWSGSAATLDAMDQLVYSDEHAGYLEESPQHSDQSCSGESDKQLLQQQQQQQQHSHAFHPHMSTHQPNQTMPLGLLPTHLPAHEQNQPRHAGASAKAAKRSKTASPLLTAAEECENKRKRTPLPNTAIDVMKAWLFKNTSNPYPTEETKKTLAHAAGISLAQINNWFINARRRLLPASVRGKPG